jgi:hypothetical protein
MALAFEVIIAKSVLVHYDDFKRLSSVSDIEGERLVPDW